MIMRPLSFPWKFHWESLHLRWMWMLITLFVISVWSAVTCHSTNEMSLNSHMLRRLHQHGVNSKRRSLRSVQEFVVGNKTKLLKERDHWMKQETNQEIKKMNNQIQRNLNYLPSKTATKAVHTHSKNVKNQLNGVSFPVTTFPPFTTLESNKTSVINRKQRSLADENVDSATFHPDDVLFKASDRMLHFSGEKVAPKNSKDIIGMDEAEKLPEQRKQPITPLKIHPEELPELVPHSKLIPHRLSKHPESVDFESRKLFIREKLHVKNRPKRQVRKLDAYVFRNAIKTAQKD